MTALEDAARTLVIAEMVAEGIVWQEDGVLVLQNASHRFMVEVKVLDCTAEKEMT